MSKLLNIILPTPCVICTKLGSPICLECKRKFPAHCIPIEVLGVKGCAISDYSLEAALLINSVKEKGITSLIPTLADLIVQICGSEHEEPCLVPIPSSRSNTKKRGFSHTSLLARAIARRIPKATYLQLLSSSKARFDQVGLSPGKRAENMAGAFTAELRLLRSKDRPVVLVDDVLTSGATMASAIGAMHQAGLQVAGFLVFARAGAN